MKNKEIEELLNDMRHSYEIHEEIIKKYNNADKISYPYRINLKQIKLLLSYIEQLENKNKENSLLLIEFQDMEQRIEQLQNNRDKAINYTDITIELIEQQPTEDDTWILDRLKGFKNILKGDSDENIR